MGTIRIREEKNLNKVCRRLAELKAKQEAEQQVKDVKSREEYNQAIMKMEQAMKDKEQELNIIKNQLAGLEEKKKLEISQALTNAEDLTTRKLTYKNHTMKALFDEAREQNSPEEQ